MPTYEFVCPEGHTFDKFFRKISDSVAELPCPVCGEPAIRKISGGAGLVFKGSGFYITDYGKDGKKAQSAPAKTEGKGGGDGAATSTGAGSSGSGGSTTPSKPSGSSE
ncbi:MAG TPA: zinc ribbon domain-containing protein [Gemmatimonadaceae bacterium]|nr:zinc ribbon domain-containing protein [Gemmatimonadaceae bacterium]